jgi:hypothetical protein
MRVGLETGLEERGGKPGRRPLPAAHGGGWPAGLALAVGATLALSLIGVLAAMLLN